MAAAVLNYFDRSALAIANPLIRADLHLSVAQMGVLLSAFLFAYAFCQLPIDRAKGTAEIMPALLIDRCRSISR